MKRIILGLCLLICVAAVKPAVQPARSPKDVATAGSNAVMRATNGAVMTRVIPAAPSPVKSVPTVTGFAGTRPKRDPWVVTKSFALDPVFGATGYRVYYAYGDHQLPAGHFDIGNNMMFTVTNLPPRRPMWFWATALNGAVESTASQTIAYMEVPVSSWIDATGQHFAYKVPPGRVIDVDAESKLNGTKRHISTQTNITVLLVTEPVQSQDSFIVTAK
jgi:hypothetical protein